MRRFRFAPTCVLAVALTGILGCEYNAADSKDADEQAIREAELKAVRALNDGDVDGYMAVYPEDSAWLPPNAPTIRGADAVRAVATQFTADPEFAFEVQVDTVEVSGDGQMAYLIGTYQLTLSDADGNPNTDHGKFVEVWKKYPNDSWNHVLAIWNSNEP